MWKHFWESQGEGERWALENSSAIIMDMAVREAYRTIVFFFGRSLFALRMVFPAVDLQESVLPNVSSDCI